MCPISKNLLWIFLVLPIYSYLHKPIREVDIVHLTRLSEYTKNNFLSCVFFFLGYKTNTVVVLLQAGAKGVGANAQHSAVLWSEAEDIPVVCCECW